MTIQTALADPVRAVIDEAGRIATRATATNEAKFRNTSLSVSTDHEHKQRKPPTAHRGATHTGTEAAREATRGRPETRRGWKREGGGVARHRGRPR